MRHLGFEYFALTLLAGTALMVQPAIAFDASATSDWAEAKSPPAGEVSGTNSVNESQESLRPAPVPFLTLEELPAAPPQVRFEDGQLTIESENSTLGDILVAVGKATGAQVEMPAGFSTERAAVRLGPGPASNVVSELMHGSKFGLIVVSTAENPSAVQKILITKAAPPAGEKKVEAQKVTTSVAAPAADTRTVATAAPAPPVAGPTGITSELMPAVAPQPAAASAPDGLSAHGNSPRHPPRFIGGRRRAARRTQSGIFNNGLLSQTPMSED